MKTSREEDKSSSTKTKAAEEPPDSLTDRIKRIQTEPVKERGSFFVLKKKREINIKPGITERGFKIVLGETAFDVVYPKDVWVNFPLFYKKILAENLTFALTLHLPYLLPVRSLNYLMARPISEPFFFKVFTLSLPSTALMKTKEKQTTSNLLKKFFETEFHFNREKNVLTSSLNPRETSKTAILPFSFGKDSLLTYALCKELGIKTVPVFIKEPLAAQENFHKENLAQKFWDEFKEKLLIIDNRAGNCREGEEGWYGWELQLTQYLLMALPVAFGHKARYFFFANEQSCNDRFLDKEGFWCNPVYEQSVECLEQTNDLVESLGIKNLKIGSLVEPVHELAIVKILHSRYPQIAKFQTSCFAEKPEAKKHRWCGNCSKCARIFIFFLAHNIDARRIGIPGNMLELKHKDKFSIFENGNAKDSGYDQSRLGRDEQLLAFYMAYKNGHKGDLINLFKALYLEEAENREKELREKYFGIHSVQTLPKELKEQVLNIYRKELKDLK